MTARDDSGATALFQASQNGHADVVEFLLSRGAGECHLACDSLGLFFGYNVLSVAFITESRDKGHM